MEQWESRPGLPFNSKCQAPARADQNKRKMKKRKKTTCNLVINPKIAVQREQQQPSKLQSNFSFMLQAPGFRRLWGFCRSREGGGGDKRKKEETLTPEHQLFCSSLQQPGHSRQKLPPQSPIPHRVSPPAWAAPQQPQGQPGPEGGADSAWSSPGLLSRESTSEIPVTLPSCSECCRGAKAPFLCQGFPCACTKGRAVCNSGPALP